ncbi:AI-2E family transporter [Microterricola pindariensis]|uniref:AI-2E family transporter n=1 Tax=Microterricola pindariensis TaxID=478010 RepID=A0ABX5AZH3_9MICO|nr:AI-2E family transporter [Microterricola pindariensis]PPL20311.1 AI-2E family transporter [Microterricola pindariensis]
MSETTPESAGPAPARRYSRGVVILVGLAAGTVVAVGMSSIRSILGPVLLTVVLTICAQPVRTALERRGVPRGLATGSVVLVLFAGLAGLAYTFVIAVTQFVAMLPDYADQFAAIAANFGDFLQKLGVGTNEIEQVKSGFDPSAIAGFFGGLVGGVASITATLVIILTMLILLAADASYVPTVLVQLGQRRPHLKEALVEYASGVRRYMVVTTVLGLIQGAINGIALWLLHVPAALLWAILAFLCSYIPNIGYFIAIIPPLVFGYFVGGWPTFIAVIIIYGLVNAVVQSIIQPRVVGNAVALSQSLTFFSVLFWAIVIGPIGAVLAIPLTLLARAVLVDADPTMRWWRPALGDVGEARSIMAAADAEAKANRHRDAGHTHEQRTRRSGTGTHPPIPPRDEE